MDAETPVRVVLLDVDFTLTRRHVSHMLAQAMRGGSVPLARAIEGLPPNGELVSMQIEEDIAAFRALIAYCARSHTRVALASFGYREFIETLARDLEQWFPVLREVWLRKCEQPLILTPGAFGALDGTDALRTKDCMLERVCGLARVQPREVLLVDDSPENVASARRWGAHVFQVRGGDGLVAYECNRLRERMERQHLRAFAAQVRVEEKDRGL